MDIALLSIVVWCLVFAVVLNLLLTFRLINIVHAEPDNTPLTLPIGEEIPDVEGLHLLNGQTLLLNAEINQPMVLVFLASGCKDCKSKLPELSNILESMDYAGVLLWVIGTESEKRIRNFLGSTALLKHVVMMQTEMHKLLNPKTASPYYLFIDEKKILQASGFIGDEDWLSFMKQMHSIKIEMSTSDVCS